MLLILAITASLGHSAAALEVIVKDDKNTPLANVAIALYPKTPVNTVARSAAQVQQKDKLFNPFVLVVQKGATVEFPNLDRTRHHVYSFSKAKEFDLPLFLGASKAVLFDSEGIVSVGCNIHDWMLAYVVVVDTPYFATTDAEGVARITGMNPGEYSLRYWYPGMKSDMIEKDANMPASADRYQITVPAGAVQKQPPKPLWADDQYE